jgi:hypothetical protein
MSRQIDVERAAVTWLCINVNKTWVAHDSAVNDRAQGLSLYLPVSL